MENKNSLRCAITIDIEPNLTRIVNKTGDKYSGITKAMPKLLDLLAKHSVPFTWFITHDYWGKMNQEFPSLVERMSNNGEIGCHVHFRNEKEYHTDYNFQVDLIKKATNSLREQGFNVKSFRGGNLFFNEHTLKVLEDLNYEVDSSVYPGMYLERHNNLTINHKQCTSIKPYFLSNTNHCIPGSSKILEIPVTVHPYFQLNTRLVSFFISRSLPTPLTSEYLLRTHNFSKKIIRKDSSIPIVILAHPWEFIDNTEKKLKYLEKFILSMKSSDVKFVTLNQMSACLNQTRNC